MRILVTGSGGMLGSDLCKILIKEGCDLTGIDVKDNTLAGEESAFDTKCIDITDKEKTQEFIESERFDLVIHTAAYTAVDECELNKELAYCVNSKSTRHIAQACQKIKALMIFISTDYVFDGKKKTPYEIDDRTNPLSEYGRSKLKAEDAVREYLDKYLIIRTSWLYGENGPNFVKKIIDKAKKVKKLDIVNDQVGAPTYTVDFSDALFRLIGLLAKGKLKKNDLGIYHITNSGNCNWYEYAKKILAYADINSKAVDIQPIKSLKLKKDIKNYAPRPAYSVLSNRRFEKLLGFKMRNWQAALEEYIKRDYFNS